MKMEICTTPAIGAVHNMKKVKTSLIVANSSTSRRVTVAISFVEHNVSTVMVTFLDMDALYKNSTGFRSNQLLMILGKQPLYPA